MRASTIIRAQAVLPATREELAQRLVSNPAVVSASPSTCCAKDMPASGATS